MTNNIELIETIYSVLLDSEDLVTLLTPGRVRKYVNKAYCDFFERTEEDLIGTSFIEMFSPEKKMFYKKFIEYMSPENPSITTTQRSGAPGLEKWIHWKETGVFDENGSLVEVIAVGRDVDEIVKIKKEKETLLNTLSAYRKAIDLNIICSITDVKGKITYANNKFCEISKYSKSELIGHSHSIINSGYHPKSFFADMWSAILSGKMWHGEIKNKAKDGTFYWVNTVIMPLREDRNDVSGFLSLRILIDEQKKLEEEKNNYVRSIEDMLFMVSHELRKPIVSCEGVLHIMRSAMPEKEEYDTMLSHLIDSAKELDGYSRKLNDYLQNNIRPLKSGVEEEY